MVQVKQVAEAMFAARSARDADGMAKLVSDDFKYTEYTMNMVGVGRDAWMAYVKQSFAFIEKDTTSIRSVRGDAEHLTIEFQGVATLKANASELHPAIPAGTKDIKAAGIMVCSLDPATQLIKETIVYVTVLPPSA